MKGLTLNCLERKEEVCCRGITGLGHYGILSGEPQPLMCVTDATYVSMMNIDFARPMIIAGGD